MNSYYSNNNNNDYFDDDNIENFNEKISLDDLYDRKREIEKNRMNIYKKILARVHNKIRITARTKHNEHHLFYLVPEFIFGIPRYDVNTCISYIIDKLVENGFQVKYTHPNLLFISWNHYIPSYKRQEIKLNTGVSIDGFGNVIQKSKKGQNNNKNDDDGDINTLMLNPKKNNNTEISISKSNSKKDYKDIDSYKPSGIYNQDLLNKLKDKFS